MIKRLIMILLLISFFTPINCKASSPDDTAAAIDEYKQQLDSSLESGYDNKTKAKLDEFDISPEEPSSAVNISISKVIGDLWQSFVSALTEPLRILGKLIAVCIFTVMVKSVAESSQLSSIYDTSGVLVTILVLYQSTENILGSVKSSLDDISVFMTTYIPVFSGVLAQNANISSAVSYYSVMLVLCELISFISTNILLPFLGVIFALSIVGAVNGRLDLDGAIGSVKSIVKWVLTALMSVFTGVLSMKGIVSASADSLAAKTVRLAASSFIPIVGGAVSESYSTIYGSLGVIRSGVGFFGIAAVTVIALRPIIAIAALKLSLTLASFVNSLLGQRRTASFITGLDSVLSISLGVVTALSMIFIISTAVIMLTTMNVG